MKQIDPTKYKKLEKKTGSELWDMYRLLIANFPEIQLDKMIWLAHLKRTSINYFQLEQLLEKAWSLEKKYNKVGFIFNKIKQNKKPKPPKQYDLTLFGLKERK